MLSLVVVLSSIKKVCQKRRRKNSANKLRKVEKEKLKDRLVYVHKCWKFSHQVVQPVCYLCLVQNFGWVWAQHLHPNHTPCLHQLWNFFARVCDRFTSHSYLVVSTRQGTSSLDCYLTLQQLEFRLHSLCITPHQAPHKSHHNRYSGLVFASLPLLVTTTHFAFQYPIGNSKELWLVRKVRLRELPNFFHSTNTYCSYLANPIGRWVELR